jgi:hypothetical protein
LISLRIGEEQQRLNRNGSQAREPSVVRVGEAGSTCRPVSSSDYTYQLRSLPERTGRTGRWPITATAVWVVTWTL